MDEFPDKQAPFNTFSVHRYLDSGESVIKIFSPKQLSDEFLDKLFLERSWTYRKGWHAFPELEPVANKKQFPSFIIKPDENEDSGIIYTGAFENFISVRNMIFFFIIINVHNRQWRHKRFQVKMQLDYSMKSGVILRLDSIQTALSLVTDGENIS